MEVLANVKRLVESDKELNKTVLIAWCDASANDIPGITPGLQRFSALLVRSSPPEWHLFPEAKDAASTFRFLTQHLTPGKNMS